MTEYVFPQTPSSDPNFNREGGLTKLEYVALAIYMGNQTSMPLSLCFDLAESFLKEAAKREQQHG